MLSNWEIVRKIQENLKTAEQALATEIVKVYADAADELERDIAYHLARSATEGGTVDLGYANRYGELKGQVEQTLGDFASHVNGDTAAAVRKIAGSHLEKYQASLQAVLPEGIAYNFNRVWPEIVTSIMKRKVEGVPFSERLQRIPGEVGQDMMNQLAIGAARGEGVGPLRKRLLQTADIGRYRAEVIGRTEVIRASNEAGDWTYAQYGPLIKFKRRLVTVDKRTCIACISQDGKEYALNDPMDDHPQGRCVFTAVLPEWNELGYDVPDTTRLRRARDPYSGENQVVKFKTAQQWFEEQPEGVQRGMMGASRYRLWREGRIGWEDIAGPGSSIVPVRNLRIPSGGWFTPPATPPPPRGYTPATFRSRQDAIRYLETRYADQVIDMDIFPLGSLREISGALDDLYGKYNCPHLDEFIGVPNWMNAEAQNPATIKVGTHVNRLNTVGRLNGEMRGIRAWLSQNTAGVAGITQDEIDAARGHLDMLRRTRASVLARTYDCYEEHSMWAFPPRTYEGILRHEMGHLVHFKFDADLHHYCAGLGQHYLNYFDWWLSHFDDMPTLRAKHNPWEGFAECFSLWSIGKPDVPADLVDFFERFVLK